MVSRAELLQAVRRVAPALISQESAPPVFRSVFFDGARVTAFDDEIALSSKIDFDGFQGGLDGKLLIGWLSTCTADDVHLEKQSKSSVKLTCGRSKLFLSTLGLGEAVYKRPDDDNPEDVWLGAATNVVEAARLVIPCMGSDMAHPTRVGVTVSIDNDGIATVAATNNVTMAVASVQTDVVAPYSHFEFVMWPRFASMLESMSRMDGVRNITIGVDCGWLLAEFESGDELFGKTGLEVDIGTFVGMAESLDADLKFGIPVGDRFAEVVERVAKIAQLSQSKNQTAALKITSHGVQFSVNTGLAALADSVACRHTHSECSIVVNTAMLKNVMAQVTELAVSEHVVGLRGPAHSVWVSAASGAV